MEKSNKVIKVVALVIAFVLVLGIGIGAGVFIKENDTQTENEKTKVEKNEDASKSANVTENKGTINDSISSNLIGAYEGETKVKYTDKEETGYVRLLLCDNGAFAYYYDAMTACHYEGYYQVKNNNLILHCILNRHNDPGATIVKEILTLKINDDGSIVDNVKVNTTLKKSSNTTDEKVDLGNSIELRFDNDCLFSEKSISKQETTTNKSETSSKDYSKYYGTWTDNGSSEFVVKNIGNNLITFTWAIYRTASIDDVTLPFKDNKAVFYYQGYYDSNYNGVNEDNEHYYRKATIELRDNDIVVTVENVTSGDASLDKTTLFGGGVYVTPNQYVYTK